MRILARWTAYVVLAAGLGNACAPPASAGSHPDEQQVANAAHGMVVCQQPLAARAGLEVLKAGGNAVDAAVAAAFALAVVHPQAGNLGGGGFMLVYHARDSLCTLIDFRETAPHRSTPDMYLDARGDVDTLRARAGHWAVGVPGTPAGLQLAWSKYGRRPWRSLVAPAVRLAQEGFPVNAELAANIGSSKALLARFPSTLGLFAPGGKQLRAGDRLVQKDLARTLRLVAQSGALTFYEGAVADLIAKEVERGHGILTREDLTSYRAVERRPLRGRYRDLDVLVAPPPSSGGSTLLQMLALLEYYDLHATAPLSAYRVHLTAEVMARAFADRNTYLGDPDFVRVPLHGLLAPAYIAGLQAGIAMDRATPSDGVRPGDPWRYEGAISMEVGPAADTLHTVPTRAVTEGNHTTHVSVVDAEGNIVSLTTTLNSWFGSGVLVQGGGFLLNNEMDDFDAKPGAANQYELVGGVANAIAPGKRMLSSMAPAIVMRGHRPWLVLGSPGGPRIISTELNVLLDVRDHGMSLEAAVACPRFHHQWRPNVITAEPNAFTSEVRDVLHRMGHVLREEPPWSSAQCIEIRPDGTLHGVSDPRSGGAALGY